MARLRGRRSAGRLPGEREEEEKPWDLQAETAWKKMQCIGRHAGAERGALHVHSQLRDQKPWDLWVQGREVP